MRGYTLKISVDLEYNKALWRRGLPDDVWCGDHHTFWVLRDAKGNAAGFCSAVILPNEAGCFLSSAVVFTEHRGKGLQRAMIKRRLAWAKRNGAKYALTYTVHGNWASAYNLLRLGFRPYDPAFAWAGRAWYFEKPL